MRPRRLSDGTTFDSNVLKAIQTAFDEAWERISDSFLADERDGAREQLADAVMNVARHDSSDIAMMRDAALRAMAMHYPGRFAESDAGQKSGVG